MRDQPHSIQDGPLGFEPHAISNFDQDGDPAALTPDIAQKLAREAYESSTTWLQNARRGRWADSLRAFNNQHPQGSKYLSREYAGRSTLYRPMTRTMVRKGEASTASAFFANEDVVSVKADNDDDPMQQASAEVLQALLQYRLEKTIPWFQTLVGARQDAEVLGIAVGKVWWQYEEKHLGTKAQLKLDPDYGMPVFNEDGEPEMEMVDHFRIVHDRPRVDLISPENIRIDPGSDWRNPIKSSPYVIELVPMFVQDVEAKIQSGEWFEVPTSALRAASDLDTTRAAREAGRVPGQDYHEMPAAFDTCWVRNNIIRHDGEDYQFWSLQGSGELLTDPVPLGEVYLHGERPYVIGGIVMETHKVYPSSKTELTRDLQRVANDDLNLRFDAVKMALNPRQFVKAGAGVELNDLRTMVPGKVITVKGEKGEPPSSVISWDRPPEPGQTSFMEQQLNQLDWDALTGSFSNSSVQASQYAQQSATGMHLMSGEASGIAEYELRIFAETFVQPVLDLLIKLEQAYETDETVLAIAANKAQLFQRLGHDKVTDELLGGSVSTHVNVGIGATNPAMRLRAFQQAAQTVETVMGNPIAAMGLNFHEVLKEVFAHAGYRDGERFIKPGFDPATAMQQMEQAKSGGKGGQGNDQARLQAAQIQAQGRIEEAKIHAQVERQKLDQELARAQYQEQNENWRVKYQQDHEAWSSGLPQQAQAVHETLGNLLPAIQAMQHAALASHQHIANHQATLEQLAQSHQHLAHAQSQLAQHVAHSHAQLNRQITDVGSRMTAPKRVIRDEHNRIVGVETLPPNPSNF